MYKQIKCIFKYKNRILSLMQIDDLFNILHNSLESQNNGKKISLKDMAASLGISMRTYQDWKLGRAKPQAAGVVMTMLGKLDDDEIIRAVRKINKLQE
jgi:DNA-binding transcriptional regulator YiaG